MSQGHIQGKIVHANSLEPLAFATVLMGKSGTVSDEKGNFSIKFNEKESYFVVSYLGYRQKRVEISEFKNNSVVEMEMNAKELEEVVINSGAEKIMRHVIQHFRINYAEKPYSVIGTQVEESKVGNKTNYFLEATMRGILLSTLERQKHQIEILDVKWIEKDSMRKGDYMLWVGTGKLIEYFDLARMGREIFDSTQLKKFKFIVEESYWNDEPCYKITCLRKKASKFSSEATFYVIKSSYAVAGYQYMEDEKSKNPGEAMVTYQCINQKWYLNDIKTIQKNHSDHSIISVNFKTISLDTNATFDIAYDRAIQERDVMLLSKQMRFYKNDLQSKKLVTIDSQPRSQIQGLKLFIYDRMRLLAGLGSPAFKLPEHNFHEQITSTYLQINQIFQANIPSTFPILFFWGSRIKIKGPWILDIENSQNFKLGGSLYSSLSIGSNIELISQPYSRPKGIFMNGRYGSQVDLSPIGELTLDPTQMNLMDFTKNKTNAFVEYSKTYVSVGIGAFWELNRRRKIGLELRFNHSLGEKRFVRFEDPTRISFFKKDFKIPINKVEFGDANSFNIILKIM
jgi:hypothetical protein